MILPSKPLPFLVLLKQKSKEWKLFKIKNEDTRTTSMASLWCFYCKLWTYSTLCSNCWLTFEMISCNFVLLQILFAGRLIRSYLNVDKNASKCKFTWEAKWTHFGVQSNLYLGKNLWLRVKTKASLKPGLKTEFFWNTFDKEFAGEIKYVKKNYLNKSSLLNFQNSLPLRVTYVKYLEKNSIAIGIVYSYIFSFLYQFAVKWKACDKHSIHL